MIEWLKNYPDFTFAVLMCILMGVILLLENARDHMDDE